MFEMVHIGSIEPQKRRTWTLTIHGVQKLTTVSSVRRNLGRDSDTDSDNRGRIQHNIYKTENETLYIIVYSSLSRHLAANEQDPEKTLAIVS